MLQNPKCNYVSNLELSRWKVISVKIVLHFISHLDSFLLKSCLQEKNKHCARQGWYWVCPLLIPASADAHTSMTSSLF